MKLDHETVVNRFLGFDPATLYEAAGHRGMVDPAIRPAWAGARLCGVVATGAGPAGDNHIMKLEHETAVNRFLGFDPATLYEAAGHRGMVDPAIRPAWAGARLCG